MGIPDAHIRPLPSPPLNLLRGASLFLDFDGTIVPIAARPDSVVVVPRLRDVLALLSACLDGRLALVSGRAAFDVRRLLDEPPFPIAGSHGLELLWPDGRLNAPGPPIELHALQAELDELRAHYPAVFVEPKPYGAALHYRQAPQAEDACRDLAFDLAARSGLIVMAGKMVFEIRLPGADKGSAVEALTIEPPMAGSRPIFIGDDLTDEAGFAAVARLGGAGVLVGAPRDTAATYRLDDVEATLGWLEHAAGVSI